MSSLVSATEISLSIGQKTLLNKVSVEIDERDIIGIVGRNGCGKSTFLKLLAGLVEPDEGKLILKKGTTIGYLSQEVELESSLTVWQALNLQNTELDELNKRANNNWQTLISLLKEDLKTVYQEIFKIIIDLNCSSPDSLITNLSGGEKRKIAIIKAIIDQPDLLILDEPTNHLDILTVEKLEKILKKYKGAIVVVSHDRYFLDNLTTRIVEIFDAQIFNHPGNYQQFLQSKALRQEIAFTTENKRQSFLTRELGWVRAGVKARGTKDKGRLERFNEIKSQKSVFVEQPLDLLLPPSTPLGNKILNLIDVNLSVGNKKIVQDLNFSFTIQTVLGIVGVNGSGKTSLIKAILQQIPIQKGKIEVGYNTVFNYQDQQKLVLDFDKSIFEEVVNSQEVTNFGDKTINSRAYLNRFLFDNLTINNKIKTLSGGEKARVLLAKILKIGGNFLILDEPTNDLDLETIRVLEESILNFEGAAIVVSHDRYFLNRVCNQILFLDGNGDFVLSTGNYDDLLAKINPAVEDIKVKIPDPYKNYAKDLRAKNKQISQLEREIAELEGKIKTIKLEFDNPDFYNQNPKKYIKKTEELDGLNSKLEETMARWEKLVG